MSEFVLKTEKTCSRCNRTESVTVTSPESAKADAEAAKKRASNWELIKKFVSAIPAAERPMNMVFLGEKSVAHNHLCSSGGPKTNCLGRVGTLLEGVNTLPPRKPRAKKGEAAAAAAVTTPPASTPASAPTSTPAGEKHDEKHGKKK